MVGLKMAIIFLLLTIISVTHGVNRTKERDDKMMKQYFDWTSRKYYHSCRYTRSDFEYFKSLCQRPLFQARAVTGQRKEYRCMSTAERNGYHDALRRMKNTNMGAQSQYDGLAVLHDSRSAPSAHFGPGFCGWHRVYLMLWERAVKRSCGNCFLNYWDSRLDARLRGDPRDSVIFSPQLAGNADGIVNTGFAANWRIPGTCANRAGGTLRRFFDSDTNSLYSDRDAAFPRRVSSFEDMSFPWNDDFEFTHGYVHTAFGGNSHMADILCSPMDPMFISHHAFVDKMCDEARVRLVGMGRNYPNVFALNSRDLTGSVRAAAADALVRPFNSGLYTINHRDATLRDELDPTWFSYERSPADVSCTRDEDCCSNGNTEFLFCQNRQCISKAQQGARISTTFPDRACYCPGGQTPRNNGGRCECA